MIEIPTPHGLARVRLEPAAGAGWTLVLGHGAGGGVGAGDLMAARDAALGLGITVALVEQPYRVAGRRSPAPARQLDAAWLAVIEWLRRPRVARGQPGPLAPVQPRSPAPVQPRTPAPVQPRSPAPVQPGLVQGIGEPRLICGGRSSGARVACRTAASAGAAAVLCLAFPVHPPGRPEKSRLAELDAVSVPVLVVQGERDPFGTPPEAPGRTVVRVPGDHSLRRTEPVQAAVAAWLASISAQAST